MTEVANLKTEEKKDKLGIDQLLKIIDFFIEISNVREKFMQAKTIVGKLTALLPLTDELLGMFSLSWSVAVAQYKDLDMEEHEQMKEHFKKKHDIEDDNLEEKIEAGYELAVDAIGFVERILKFADSFKKEKVA